MGRLPVTIRTFDLGADKALVGAERVSATPALGLRAIRLCLAEPQMFHRQLRAILRASAFGRVRILVPMLSSSSELDQTLLAIAIDGDRIVATGSLGEVRAAVGGAAYEKQLSGCLLYTSPSPRD